MLTGDNQRTVNAIARQLVSTKHTATSCRTKNRANPRTTPTYASSGYRRPCELCPAGRRTIGNAVGAAGTDTAIETADIALMEDDLNKVAEAVHLGRHTLRIIQTNIIFALAIKALFLILALLGYTSLWLAILADTGATLLVILNALRLLR